MRGRSIAFTKMAFLASSPRRPCGDCWQWRRGAGGASPAALSRVCDPNNVPHTRRGATAVANAVAFFARMDALFVDEEEVVATMVAAMSSRWRHVRACSGRLGESGRGEEEDTVMTMRQ